MAAKFIRKSLTNYIYSWSPLPNDFGAGKNNRDNNNTNKNYCTAIPFSNGEDWITTYAYLDVYVGSTIKREAYVACDYVE